MPPGVRRRRPSGAVPLVRQREEGVGMLMQLARYEPVVRLLAAVPGSTLLDVGSGSRGIRPYLGDRWGVTSCDIDFSDYGARAASAVPGHGRLRASVLDLPVEDSSFDAVVAVDLLEHVEPGDRPRALQELARVTTSRLIVACPCGDRALCADRRLATYYRSLRRSLPGWLDEHLANGFPETSEIVSELASFGGVRVIGNESIGSHFALSVVEATPLVWSVSWIISRVLAATVNPARPVTTPANWAVRALRGFDRAPTYRSIVVLDRAPVPS